MKVFLGPKIFNELTSDFFRKMYMEDDKKMSSVYFSSVKYPNCEDIQYFEGLVNSKVRGLVSNDNLELEKCKMIFNSILELENYD